MPQIIPAAAAAASGIQAAFAALGTAVGLSAAATASFAVFATNLFAYATNAWLSAPPAEISGEIVLGQRYG